MAQKPDALVPVDPARPLDAYERTYMAGEGTVLFRDKVRANGRWHAAFAALILSCVYPVAFGGSSGALLVAMVLPVLLVTWTLYMFLRVTVSEAHVHVQFGLAGPKIPIAAIEQAEVIEVDWNRYRQLSRAGERIYAMARAGRRAVRIVWTDAEGGRQVTLIGSDRAEELAAQIGRARQALPASASPAALEAG
ncbi:DUF3093 family protein [Nannocystis radixulma]|uniref:DUF3093 family protein n=1 Tax=Nannocystis radixulma TaxID=2995305 RepID=A0ABT5BFN0_9BACT|nr:DUF3093 family protein [Nannocystis radixulma]MDC0672943.1 DUF3093 family protein [Nannocystis radixulma]